MTVADVKRIAMENYTRGGDVIVECWTDKDIEEFLKRNKNPIEKLKNIISIHNEEYEAAKYFSGYNEESEGDYIEKVDIYDYYIEDSDSSGCCGDYGPSNPWDAPGMSISDFI